MADSVAQDQIKAYVDRVLRMKEERKAIDADIREIYAEAKGNGFDKTVLGKLVNYVEKRNADSNAVAEGEALFELYLTAYYGAGTVVATHTHEAEPSAADQIIEGLKEALAVAKGEAEALRTHVYTETQSRPTTGSDLTTSPSLNGQVAPHSPETANNVGEAQKVERRSPKPEDAGSIPAADANKIDFRKALRPHCLNPHSCGGMGREHCWSCKKAMNAAGAA